MSWRSSTHIVVLALAVLVSSCGSEGSQGSSKDTSATTSSHFEHLKELEWFVGDWVDKTDDMVFSSIWRWDFNKNFLIQDFNMKGDGQEELKGQQIVGWDPRDGSVRSWIFDSDGGFGECSWIKEDKSWYAKTLFVLADGRVASATHIYTKIDDKNYTFSSVGRDINGEVLPDIGPFTAVKK